MEAFLLEPSSSYKATEYPWSVVSPSHTQPNPFNINGAALSSWVPRQDKGDLGAAEYKTNKSQYACLNPGILTGVLTNAGCCRGWGTRGTRTGRWRSSSGWTAAGSM